ncbi:hypothetical protein D918_01770 [Trichuris suis]|nr:hypothetical protein D918_01770 [Trichuris suis]
MNRNMQADSIGTRTEIDYLKSQLKKLQEKLSEVVCRVSNLEGDLVSSSHVDGINEDQCPDHANTSKPLKAASRSFELSLSSSISPRNLNGDRHLVTVSIPLRLLLNTVRECNS